MRSATVKLRYFFCCPDPTKPTTRASVDYTARISPAKRLRFAHCVRSLQIILQWTHSLSGFTAKQSTTSVPHLTRCGTQLFIESTLSIKLNS